MGRHWSPSGRAFATFWVTGSLLVTTIGMAQTAMARQATSAAEFGATRCEVSPRSIEEILALTETIPGEGIAVRSLPQGDPADPVTVAAIAGTLEEMGACLTAGQMLRFYALHSEDWLRRFAAQIEGLTTLTSSTPPLADGDRAVYLGPWRVQMLPDGRVMAATLLRIGEEPRPNPSRTRVLVFVERDGRWLVDETIEWVRIDDCRAPVEVAAVVGPPPAADAVFELWSALC